MTNWLKAVFLVSVALLLFPGCNKDEKYLRVDPTSIEVPSEAQSLTVSIEASASWMSYNSSGWLNSYVDLNDNTILHIDIANPNASLENRSTEIAIVTGDAQTFTLPVLQKAAVVEISIAISPDPDPGSEQKTLTFDSYGNPAYTLTVNATMPENEVWDFDTEETWLSVVRGEGDDINKLTVTASESRQFEERENNLIISPVNDAFASRAVEIPVIQHGVNLYVAPGQNVDMENGVVKITSEAADIQLSVFAVTDWTVVKTDDTENRVNLSIAGGGSDKENGVNLIASVLENTSATEYTYTLEFSCDGKTYVYKIIQSAPTTP